MKCPEIRELLSEYIDGTLDEQKRTLLEEHLMTCKLCSEEVATFRAYIKEIGSLKKVKAPDDFLEEVHQRLERRFSLNKIVSKLFVPLRLKVPLELAAVAATVMLVFYVVNLMQPSSEVAYAPPAPKPVTMAGRPVEEAVKLAKKPGKEGLKARGYMAGDIDGIALDLERAAAPPSEKKVKVIELALLIKPETPALSYGAQGAADEVSSREAVPAAEMKAREVEETGLAEKAPGREEELFRDKLAFPSPSLNETLSRVKKLIKLAEGKVIIVEYEKGTNRPQSITAEIPAAHYRSFLEKVGRLGDLKQTLPAGAEEGEGSIQLRMELVPAD